MICDNRGRLISEVRTGQSSYDLAYEYDQGGNRKKKTRTIDADHWFEDRYYYDVRPEEPDPQNPMQYDSFNNRLMFYETLEFSPTVIFFGAMTQGSGPTAQGSGPMAPGFGGPIETLLSTTYYYYNEEGNVTRVVTNEDGTNQYEATRLGYARNGQAVTYGLGETWDHNGTFITNHTVTYAREFRYDAARQRYLNRDLGAFSDTWSDYDGNRIYGDFTVTSGPPGSPPTVTELRSFQPGIAKVDPWADNGSLDTKYYHADMIGTTRHMTDLNGNEVEAAAFSAFGEQVGGNARRYGYAGAFGYQTHDDFPFLHLGHRYYDPATGRFLQRDPIGIEGGPNLYAYVDSAPSVGVDPLGFCGYCGMEVPKPGRGKSASEWYREGGAGAAAGIACGWAYNHIVKPWWEKRKKKPKPSPPPRAPLECNGGICDEPNDPPVPPSASG